MIFVLMRDSRPTMSDWEDVASNCEDIEEEISCTQNWW